MICIAASGIMGSKCPSTRTASSICLTCTSAGTDACLFGRDGNHRLMMAKLLGVARIPCCVHARHLAWQQIRERVAALGPERCWQEVDPGPGDASGPGGPAPARRRACRRRVWTVAAAQDPVAIRHAARPAAAQAGERDPGRHGGGAGGCVAGRRDGATGAGDRRRGGPRCGAAARVRHVAGEP